MSTHRDAKKDEELVSLEEILKRSRSVSDFDESLDQIGSALGLAKITTYEVEALLIEATLEKWPRKLEADMTLAALGLLEGFDNRSNTEIMPKGKDVLTKRRRKFVEESTFVEESYGKHNKKRKIHYESLDELKEAGEDAIGDVISDLGVKDAARLEELSNVLWSKKRNIRAYLKKAKEKYVIYNGETKRIIGVKLPKMFCIRKEVFICKILDQLGTSEIETEWEKIIPETWKRLGVEGEPKLVSFKSFLLTLIDRIYDKTAPDEAMRRDLSLLMLGFLDNYYAKLDTEVDRKITPSNRYDIYISLSDFMELSYFYGISYGEIDKINEVDQFDKRTNSLDNLLLIIRACKVKLVEEITNSIQSGEFQEYVTSNISERDITQSIQLLNCWYTFLV